MNNINKIQEKYIENELIKKYFIEFIDEANNLLNRNIYIFN